jgi:hypothetical protein
MKKLLFFSAFSLFTFYTFSQSIVSMEEVVRYLASPDLEGRKINTRGDSLAIQYLVNQFEILDVKPFFNQYAQLFCGRSIFTATKEELCSKNVVGFVEGSDPKLKDQYILVCAHFDHLGKVKNVYFPGANDNASGTATVLYLANYFKNNPTKRSIIFACFAGEEVGFLGSGNFIKSFTEPLKKIKYVMNLDMVGNYNEGGLCIMGTETSKLLDLIVKKISNKEHIKTNNSDLLFLNGSDHYLFYSKNIPFLCFNTGMDSENYHRPKDIANHIDFRGMDTVAKFVQTVIEALGNDSKEPVFKKIDQTKIKAYNNERIKEMLFVSPTKFGFYPGMSECGNEIEITKTTKKGDEAGLLVGDIVIKINDKAFECLMDFFELIKTEKEKPYKVTALRDGEEIEVEVY